MNISTKTLDQAREEAGLPPLVEPVKQPSLPKHLYWFFAAWAWAILFGLLAQFGAVWLSVSALIICLSCFIYSVLRTEPRPYISFRRPYRD